MKEFKFKKIDAFATKKSGGNPAGYILLDSMEEISESEMLGIAKEMQGFVNEVGYVAPNHEDGFDLRYYSSEREVDFCGHATVAIFYDLIKNSEEYVDQKEIPIFTNKGKLIVSNRLKEEDSVFVLSPEPLEIEGKPETSDIAKKLVIDETRLNPKLPITIINAGLNTLIVPILDLETTLSINPNEQELKTFCNSNGIDIIIVFSSEVINPNSDYRTRVFAPTFGYLEDPATGSGNSAFGYFLINSGLWKEGTLTIEQNRLKDAFNIVKLQKKKEGKIERVSFGGGAITRIEGKYFIY